MARLLYSDPGSHLVYQLSGRDLRSAVGRVGTVYSDAAGTVLADIAEYDPNAPTTPGPVITSSQLTVDTTSRLPWFWGPAAGDDTLWVTVNGGPLTSINAYYDPRIDDLESGAVPAYVVNVGDDIQAAIDAAAAAGGGVVWLRPGTHTHTGLTMRSGVILDGGATEIVDLVLAAGADTDCIVTLGFASLTGTGASGLNNSGPHGWAVRNLTIVGSQASQAGTSWGIRTYGYDWTLDGVHIRDCLSGGLYSEWGDFGLSDVDAPGMEAHVYRSKIHHNSGPGWHHRGPHDSHAVDVVIWENVGYGLWAESSGVYSANGTVLVGVHCYGSVHTWAMVWDGQIHATGCQVEGASTGQLWIRYGDCTWSGGAIYDIAVAGGAGLGVRLGDTTGGVLTTGARIDTILTGWKGSSAATAAVDFQSTAQCEVLARVWLTTATGTAINGTPDTTDTVMVTVGGAGMSAATAASRSAVILQGSYLQRLPAAANAWLLQAAGGADVLNVNTSSGRVELLGGRQVWLYSDPYYGSPTIKVDGAAGHIAVVSTTVPTAVAGGALGVGAPAILVDGVSNDQRGLLGFGTGLNAFPGNAISVTFASAFPTTPQVVLQARNGATAALLPFPSSISPNGFSVELQVDPADNQPAGTYYVSYVVMG